MTRIGRGLALAALVQLGCASTDSRTELAPPSVASASASQLEPRTEHHAAEHASEPGPRSDAEIDPRFEATLLSVAREYRDWKAVDDEMRFAPHLCRIPMPAALHWSDSDDTTTHGSKLYLLYAKDPVAYGWPPTFEGIGVGHDPAPEQPSATAEIRQAIVKESFAALAHDDEGRPPAGVETHPFSRSRPASRDGKLFSAGEPLALYVMVKLPPNTPGTDEGWVYGTLTSDGATVISAGRVQSCMGCHEAAPHDRLFGRKPAPSQGGPPSNAAPR
jgi:hypothetical protein